MSQLLRGGCGQYHLHQVYDILVISYDHKSTERITKHSSVLFSDLSKRLIFRFLLVLSLNLQSLSRF